MRDKDGNCPGGLSVKQYQQVEGTLASMKPQAAARTRTLLDRGNIHAGELPGDVYGRTSKKTGKDVTVNTARRCFMVLTCSVFNDPHELASTLLHEGKHVDQLGTKPPLHSYESWYQLNRNVFEAQAEQAEVADRATP